MAFARSILLAPKLIARSFRWLSTIDRRLVWMLVLCHLLGAVAAAGSAVAISLIVNKLAGPRSDGLGLLLAVGFVLTLGAKLAEASSSPLVELQHSKARTAVRDVALAKYSSVDLASLDRTDISTLFSRLRNSGDVNVALLTISMNNTIESIGRFVVFATVLTVSQPWVGLVALVACLPGLFAVGRVQVIRSRQRGNRIDLQSERDAIEDVLSSRQYAEDIRLYTVQKITLAAWRKITATEVRQKQSETRERARRSILADSPAIVMEFASITLVVYAVIHSALSLGVLVLLVAILSLMRTSFVRIAQGAGEMSEHIEVLDDLAKLESLPATIERSSLDVVEAEGRNGGRPVERYDRLGTRSVSFRYGAQSPEVLRNVTVTLRRGEVTGLVGVNGGGKTTLTRLLTRLYDPDEGEVLVDDTDVKRLPLEDFRSRVAVVGQSFARYPFSLRFNVFLSDQPNPAEEQRVADAAGLSELIAGLPSGWDTVLSRQLDDGGAQLSGGQWQRVAVARALARRADVYILDEPTSSLDALAELQLFTRYRELMRESISLMITHRFTSVSRLDRILVLADGAIVGDGAHGDVLRDCELYASMYAAQAAALDGLAPQESKLEPPSGTSGART